MNKHLPVNKFNEIKKTFKASKKNGFVTAINARNVHEWLGVGRDFSTWIKSRIDKYGFVDHVDYCIVENLSSPNLGSAKSRRQMLKEYHCTPDMVKQLAMAESTEKGKQVRLYFLDCEAVAHQKILSDAARAEARLDYIPMSRALKTVREEQGKDTKPYHFSNEADLINRIVFGMTSKKYREHHEIGKDESVRDYVNPCELAAIVSLQKANTAFIEMEMSYDERKDKLTNLFNKRHAKKIISEIDILES